MWDNAIIMIQYFWPCNSIPILPDSDALSCIFTYPATSWLRRIILYFYLPCDCLYCLYCLTQTHCPVFYLPCDFLTLTHYPVFLLTLRLPVLPDSDTLSGISLVGVTLSRSCSVKYIFLAWKILYIVSDSLHFNYAFSDRLIKQINLNIWSHLLKHWPMHGNYGRVSNIT